MARTYEPPALSVSDKTTLMATATDRQKIAKENSTVPDAGERRVSLLVVEDDENISSAISEYFSRAGYDVKTVEDGLTGVKTALDDPPDAVVLDLMLPKMDGLAVCKELREKVGYLPILMLTAKDDVVDKVLGLEMGADDYITKPFSLRELEARIKSVLRRSRNGPSPDGIRDEAPIVRGRLRIDSAKREVTIGDRQVELTPKEFDLLRLFASNPGRVFPRKYLLEKIWDYSYEGYDRTIDSHINRLRAKIEENPENPQMVLTVWGIGYKFSDEQ
jgi:DNA-binding response OmpR family regulator